MTPKEIEKLIEDLTLAYASGEEGENGWLIKGKANKEKAELIVRKHYEESKNKNELLELKAELSIYREIVSKSNFCQMVINEKEIIEPEPYQREMIFTQRQIEALQHKVFAITGEGEVMKAFNELLCVSAR